RMAPVMRPLLLAYDFPPMDGGIARALDAIAREGAMRVSTGLVPGAVPDARVGRVPLPSERLRTAQGLFRWSRHAAALLQRERAGLVWAGNLKPAGDVAESLRRRRGVAWGMIVHGLDLAIIAEQANRSSRRRWIARWLFRNASVIVANSEWTAARARQ